jgi:hypothetical protein
VYLRVFVCGAKIASRKLEVKFRPKIASKFLETSEYDLSTSSGRLGHFIQIAFGGDPLPFAVAVKRSQSTVYNWLAGTSTPKLTDIAQMHEIGCDARWIVVGVGEMFSDTDRGRELARSTGGKVAKVTGARPAENQAESILRDLRTLITKHERG